MHGCLHFNVYPIKITALANLCASASLGDYTLLLLFLLQLILVFVVTKPYIFEVYIFFFCCKIYVLLILTFINCLASLASLLHASLQYQL